MQRAGLKQGCAVPGSVYMHCAVVAVKWIVVLLVRWYRYTPVCKAPQ